MSRLPALKFREIDRFLIGLGFQRKRQSGSHVFYAHPDGKTTVVPKHPGKDIGRGLLRQILADVELSPKEFLRHF